MHAHPGLLSHLKKGPQLKAAMLKGKRADVQYATTDDAALLSVLSMEEPFMFDLLLLAQLQRL